MGNPDCGQKRLLRMCPICKGAGQVPAPLKRNRIIENTVVAQLLHREGYSQRDIMRFLGYKSPRSVSLCLARTINNEGVTE